MFSAEIQHRIWHEQQRDYLRAIERQKLLKQARLQQSTVSRSYARQVRHWLGGKLVRWGSTLQRYDAPSLPANVARKAH